MFLYVPNSHHTFVPALSPDDKVLYIGSEDHNFYALDATAGELIWKYETGGEIISSPVVSVVDAGTERHLSSRLFPPLSLHTSATIG